MKSEPPMPICSVSILPVTPVPRFLIRAGRVGRARKMRSARRLPPASLTIVLAVDDGIGNAATSSRPGSATPVQRLRRGPHLIVERRITGVHSHEELVDDGLSGSANAAGSFQRSGFALDGQSAASTPASSSLLDALASSAERYCRNGG